MEKQTKNNVSVFFLLINDYEYDECRRRLNELLVCTVERDRHRKRSTICVIWTRPGNAFNDIQNYRLLIIISLYFNAIFNVIR